MLHFPVQCPCFRHCVLCLLILRTLISNVPYFHTPTHLSGILLCSSLLSLPFLSSFALLCGDITSLAVLCAWPGEAEAAARVSLVVVAVIQEYLRVKVVERILTPVSAVKTLQ